MGRYVNDSIVSLGAEYDYDDAVREIGGLLGVEARKDGYIRLSDCIVDSIAMWAKNKPFVKVNTLARFSPATAEERAAANYGLTIPYATSPITLMSRYYNQEGDEIRNNGWAKRLPKCNDSEPTRLRDFDGYYHDAICPFATIVLPQSAINQWETSGFTIAIPTSNNGVDNGAIKMMDIEAIADCYFTVQIRHRNPSGNGVYIRTISADKTVRESDGGVIEFSTYQLPKGVWDVIPFLSPIRFTTDDDGVQVPSSYRYYPIPKCYAGELTISEVQYILAYFDGFKSIPALDNPTYGIAFNFAVKNNTASSHTFNDVIMRIRYPDKAFDDILTTDEMQVDIQPFTVVSGETKDYASAVSEGSLPLKWVAVTISQELYNNRAGIVAYLQLGKGQEVHKMYFKATETDVPEYELDNNL